jgi:seryl-tRNA synthetase
MHDLKDLALNLDGYKKNLGKRNWDVSILDLILSFDVDRKSLTTKFETNRAEVNNISKKIGEQKKSGGDATELQNQVLKIKSENEHIEKELAEVLLKQNNLLATVPNLVKDDVPLGKDEHSNLEIIKWGQPKKFSFKPKDHVDLGEKLGLLDFEAAAKVTGARFSFIKGNLARLERAIINFMIDQHIENGYTEVNPPFIVHERSLYGTGNLPKFKEDLFKLENQDWYLIPTAEVPLTNIKREQIFNKSEFPIKLCAYTPCFRSEAGSYGKDTRGLIRQHQFNKVELVNIVAADKSDEAHEQMLLRARSILEKLHLPYRVVVLCSGDMGFGARKTFDIEVWLPAQNTYREISSISNCWDFQARRAEIRYRDDDGKPKFAHTLNGSGLAVGRTMLAIMENYQNEDGSISVPEILRTYMGGLALIK